MAYLNNNILDNERSGALITFIPEIYGYGPTTGNLLVQWVTGTPTTPYVFSITEKNEGRDGSAEIDGFQRTTPSAKALSPYGRYTRVFIVQSLAIINAKDARDASIQISIAPPLFFKIPAIGEAYPVDDKSVVVSKTAVAEDGNPFLWFVTVEYDNNGSPLLEPWEVEWDFINYSKAATKDVNDDPIVDSAGYPFDPTPEIDDHRRRLIITRNSLVGGAGAFTPALADPYQDSINDDSITIDGETYPAGHLKCISWNASRFQKGGVYYWKERIVIEIGKVPWRLRILDAGFTDILGIPKLNHMGSAPVSKPWPLDGSGAFLDPGDPVVYLDYIVNIEQDFDPLNLDYSV